MSKILVRVNHPRQRSKILALGRKLTGESLSVLASRLESEEPFLEAALYRADHDENAALVREAVTELEKLGETFQIFDIPEASEHRREDISAHEISTTVLFNTLRSAEEDMEWQQDLADLESEPF